MIEEYRGDEKFWECFEPYFDAPLVSDNYGEGETSKPSLEVHDKQSGKEVNKWEQ